MYRGVNCSLLLIVAILPLGASCGAGHQRSPGANIVGTTTGAESPGAASEVGGGDDIDWAGSPFIVGTVVAVGAPTATTQLYFPLALPSSTLAGDPAGVYVGGDGPAHDEKVMAAVYPASSPIGAAWVIEKAGEASSSFLNMVSTTSVDVGSGVAARVLNGRVSRVLVWNEAGRTFRIQGPPDTFTLDVALAVARQIVDAVATGAVVTGVTITSFSAAKSVSAATP